MRSSDGYKHINIGVEQEFEVFPQNMTEAMDDIPDELPILFSIHGLEEGKNYVLSLRSSLIKKIKVREILSPKSQISRKFTKKATSIQEEVVDDEMMQ